MSSYSLPKHVHVIVTTDAAIFLDLRRDEYVALSREQARALTGLVRGWPTSDSEDQNGVTPTQLTEFPFSRELIKKGLLIAANHKDGKDVSQAAIDPTTEQLVDPDRLDQPQINIRHVLRATLAYASTCAALRLRRLDLVVQGITRRRMGAFRSPDADLSAMRDLVNVFIRIRPWLYSHHHKCLLDSLVLIRFLRSYGLHPTLVLGVTANPFNAHAWVQYEKYALNGRPDFVNGFRPILTA